MRADGGGWQTPSLALNKLNWIPLAVKPPQYRSYESLIHTAEKQAQCMCPGSRVKRRIWRPLLQQQNCFQSHFDVIKASTDISMMNCTLRSTLLLRAPGSQLLRAYSSSSGTLTARKDTTHHPPITIATALQHSALNPRASCPQI